MDQVANPEGRRRISFSDSETMRVHADMDYSNSSL